MHVLLFFIAILIAGAASGLVYVLSASWLLAGLAGLFTLWLTEGVFERSFGYQPAHRVADNHDLPAH